MSRAWIAFYMGDYQKDTNSLTTLEHGAYFLLLNECWQHGHIPIEAHKRAAVAKMSLKDWKKVAPSVEHFFNDDGTNKRATKEIAKAEQIRLKRAMAGQRGGFQSGISKAISKGRDSKYEANASQTARQNGLQNSSQAKPSLNRKLESFPTTAREGVEETQQSSGSLATAHLDSALREPLGSVPVESGLVASLERTANSIRAGNPPGRPHWVHYDTMEWRAHEHWRKSRAWKPLVPMKRVVDGVEQDGQWCEQMMPPGYDEATGERIAPATSEENAA